MFLTSSGSPISGIAKRSTNAARDNARGPDSPPPSRRASRLPAAFPAGTYPRPCAASPLLRLAMPVHGLTRLFPQARVRGIAPLSPPVHVRDRQGKRQQRYQNQQCGNRPSKQDEPSPFVQRLRHSMQHLRKAVPLGRIHKACGRTGIPGTRRFRFFLRVHLNTCIIKIYANEFQVLFSTKQSSAAYGSNCEPPPRDME